MLRMKMLFFSLIHIISSWFAGVKIILQHVDRVTSQVLPLIPVVYVPTAIAHNILQIIINYIPTQ